MTILSLRETRLNILGFRFSFILALLLLEWVIAKEQFSSRVQDYHDRVDALYGNTSAIFEWESEMGPSKAKRIPDRYHVSAYLIGGVTTRFVYFNHQPRNVLSIVITPCTSSLQVVVKFWLPYVKGHQSVHPSRHQLQLQKFRTDRIRTYHDYSARQGFYLVELKALHGSSYVHLYAESGSASVSVPSNFLDSITDVPSLPSKPKISVKRLRGNRIRVKWETSTVNPHLMNYCIVVNSHIDYHTLCAARGVKFGVLPPDLMHVSYYYYPLERPLARPRLLPKFVINIPNEKPLLAAYTNSSAGNAEKGGGPSSKFLYSRIDEKELARDLMMGCVKRKTSYIIDNLVEDKLYYFNVFIKDTHTNLTYPYLKTTIKYRTPKTSLNGLREAKPTKVLVPSSKSTILKFNLRKPCTELSMYVMSCTGVTVNFQLFLGYKALIEPQPVETFAVYKIAMPQKGAYYVRFSQPNSTTLWLQSRTNSSTIAQVYLSKKNKRFPLPKLPADTRIQEDRANRSCDAVTLEWNPSPDPDDNEYCIFLKEEHRKRHARFKKPIQCDIDRTLTRDPLVVSSQCLQRAPPPSGGILSYSIGGLNPGRTYTGQLVVRRYKGGALSYDMFQVSTSYRCENFLETSSK